MLSLKKEWLLLISTIFHAHIVRSSANNNQNIKSVEKVGEFYGKIQAIQKWLNIIIGAVFVIIGIYYCIIMYF